MPLTTVASGPCKLPSHVRLECCRPNSPIGAARPEDDEGEQIAKPGLRCQPDAVEGGRRGRAKPQLPGAGCKQNA